MTESKLLVYLLQEFHLISRKMTYATVAIVCVFAIVAWWFGIEVKGKTATLIGLMFIVLAAFTLQIPYITYRFMLKKYKNDPDKLSALGPNWQDFRDSALQRR